jgi:hypothetical protein
MRLPLSFVQDLRYAIGRLRHAPLDTIAVVVTLLIATRPTSPSDSGRSAVVVAVSGTSARCVSLQHDRRVARLQRAHRQLSGGRRVIAIDPAARCTSLEQLVTGIEFREQALTA